MFVHVTKMRPKQCETPRIQSVVLKFELSNSWNATRIENIVQTRLLASMRFCGTCIGEEEWFEINILFKL